MRKGLFFPLLGVTGLLLVTFVYDAYLITRLDQRLDALPPALKAKGWTLAWAEKSRHWNLTGDSLDLIRPVLSDANGQGWVVERLTLHARLLHPGSFSFVTDGTQILRFGMRPDMHSERPFGQKTLLTAGKSRGVVSPGSRSLTVRTDVATLSNPPLGGIDAIVLRAVTAHIVLNTQTVPDTPDWVMDLKAGSFLPELSPERATSGLPEKLSPLLAALPAPEHFHLILVALRRVEAENALDKSHGRYLIQEASFHLGPLSCVARGKISDDGSGSIWIDLHGLRAFSHAWLAAIPETVRVNPDYSHLLASVDEQTARIPDRLSLPLPIDGYDISLQNHVSAIIRGHSR